MIMTIKALAEPNRLHIVELLRDSPRSVNEIVERLRLRQPLVSKHLRVLSQAGLVKARTSAQQRIYQLEARPFEELDAWLDTFANVWSDRLDTFDDYLQTMKEESNDHDDQK
jgi:DNA-binding transcriptional ArsR family regulator